MPARLITEVIADISKLEAELKRAEARWRKYEETARKAASVSLTGGSLGSGGGSGGGGGSASAAQQQRSDLRRQEEELKAANRRTLEETKGFQRARVEAVKSAFREEADLRRRDAAEAQRAAHQTAQAIIREQRQAAQAITREQRQAAQAAREIAREDVRGQRGSATFQRSRDQETRQEVRAFQQARAAELALEREAAAAGEKAFREAERAKQRALRETAQEAKKAAREIAQAQREADRAAGVNRRSEAGDLRGQIRQVVGTGAGAGPPFRPLPTGSRPEDILALRKHLDEANAVGARLSRTLRRIGEDDLKNAAQSARFFGNALKLAAGAAIIGGFTQLVKHGIELNREWERFRFGLGTALAITSKVVDAQGKVVTGTRAFKVFAKDGEKLFQGIRDEADKTILTTQELVQVVTSNFALAIRAGVPEKEIIGLSSRIATFAKTIGLQGGTPQLVQEVRAILSGGPLRGAQVAQALGLTEKDLKAAKEKKQILELINKALADAKPLTDEFQQGSEVAFTTLASKGEKFLRLSLDEVFKRLTGRVLDLNKELSNENIERFAQKTGKVLSDLFKPIEAFLDSGRGEKLGETFAKAFKALGDAVNSKTFDTLLKFLNFIVDHHRAIALGLAPLLALRGLAGVNAAIQGLGAPGSLFAGTALGARARSGIAGGFRNTALETGGGVAAGAAGSRGLTGLRAAGATFGALGAVGALRSGAALAGQFALRALPPAAIGSLLAAPVVGSFAAENRAGDSLEEQRARFSRLPGDRNRAATARDLLAQVRRQFVEAKAAGQTATAQTKFSATPAGEDLPIQLSLEQAERRVKLAQETEEKLRRIAKEGGDRRIANEKEINFQVLNQDKIAAELRVAQLEGNVKKQQELELQLELTKVREDNKLGGPQKQRLAVALRGADARKTADREVKAFFDTERAVAEANQNRRRLRQIDAAKALDDIRKEVEAGEITRAQGTQKANAELKNFRDTELKDQRETRDKAADLVNDYTRTFLRATREQRQAREQLSDFERQTARQARDLAKQRIDTERSVTDAIVRQTRLREDVGLRRRSFGLQKQELPQLRRVRGLLSGLALDRPNDTFGGQVAADEAIQAISEQVLSGSARNPREIRQQILAGLQERGLQVGTFQGPELTRVADRLFDEQLTARRRRLRGTEIGEAETELGQQREAEELGLSAGLDVRDQQELLRLRGRRAVLGGALGASEAEALGLLERRQEGATSGTALAGADRQARESREAFLKIGEQEDDLRRESVKAFRDLTDRVKETTVSLVDDFISLGKRARELAQELPQFAGIINPAGVNAIAGLTPAGAAQRAAATGPGAINMTVDLRGGLTEGTITDPIVQHVVDLVLTKLQQDLRRGPTR